MAEDNSTKIAGTITIATIMEAYAAIMSHPLPPSFAVMEGDWVDLGPVEDGLVSTVRTGIEDILRPWIGVPVDQVFGTLTDPHINNFQRSNMPAEQAQDEVSLDELLGVGQPKKADTSVAECPKQEELPPRLDPFDERFD